MFKRDARTGQVTGHTEFDALGRPTKRFRGEGRPHLFGNGLAEIDDDQAEVLLARLAEMWRCRLGVQFPGQRFEVEVWSPDQTGGDIGIVFYQTGRQAPGVKG